MSNEWIVVLVVIGVLALFFVVGARLRSLEKPHGSHRIPSIPRPPASGGCKSGRCGRRSGRTTSGGAGWSRAVQGSSASDARRDDVSNDLLHPLNPLNPLYHQSSGNEEVHHHHHHHDADPSPPSSEPTGYSNDPGTGGWDSGGSTDSGSCGGDSGGCGGD